MTAIMIYHIRSKYTAVGQSFSRLFFFTGDLTWFYIGRKEIVLFFWMYALIELLAMLLDSGLIPTANGAYPVRSHPNSYQVHPHPSHVLVVVRSSIHRSSRRRLLLPPHQRFRRLPIRRRRHTSLSLGTSSHLLPHTQTN